MTHMLLSNNLEERAFLFAKEVRTFVTLLPRTISNIEDVKQLVRSSGSVGANYIEANEALSRKDFVHRLRISRKEARESMYWLALLNTSSKQDIEKFWQKLLQEARELRSIVSKMIQNSSKLPNSSS